MANATLTSIWIGGLFHWIITGFKGKFNDQFSEKYENRNFWTGYAITMLALVLVIYILVKVNITEQHAGASTKKINKKSNEQLIKKAELNEELKSILEEYTQMYSNPFYFDTTYINNGDTINFLLKHYCLLDSAIEVPEKYVGMYRLNSFITHNFETVIKIQRNGKQFIEKRIVKKDFEKYLYPALKEFGVLLYPVIRHVSDPIEVGYSISVPLTDVGVGVSAVIKSDGSMEFVRR